jgi:hypothetical protein
MIPATRQYYVLNQDPRAAEVFAFISQHKLEVEIHARRTRFWVPLETSVYTEFAIRFSDTCPEVTESPEDYATGPRSHD